MSLTPDMMPAWELKKHLEARDASIVTLGNEVSRLTAEVERLRAALEEVRGLVFGANHSEARYPKAHAALKVRT
jgi:hypothetical protein